MSSDCIVFKTPKARKVHRCECVRSFTRRHPKGMHSAACHIAKGQTYQVQSGIDSDCDGPFRIKLCLFHAAVCQAIWENEGASRWCFEGINFDYPWSEYIEVTNSEEWRHWLGLIRTEYRKLKSKL